MVGQPEEELVNLERAPRDAAFAARDHLLRHRTLGRHLADEAPRRTAAEHELVQAVRAKVVPELSTENIHHAEAAGAGHSRQAGARC